MCDTQENHWELNQINDSQYRINKFFMHCMLWSTILILILTFILGICYKIIGKKLPIDVIQFLYTFLGFWIPSIIYLHNMKKNNTSAIRDILKLNKVSIKNLGYSVILYLCISPAILLLAIIGSKLFPSAANNITDTMESIAPINQIFQVVFMAGIGEELIFRGIILDGYKKNNSLLLIILTNGLLFGLFHSNLFQFGYAALLGILFSTVCIYTNSILPSIILHSIHNALSIFDIDLFWFLYYFSDNVLILLLLSLTVLGLFSFKFVLKKFKSQNINNFPKHELITNRRPFKINHFLKVNWPIIIVIIQNIIISFLLANM